MLGSNANCSAVGSTEEDGYLNLEMLNKRLLIKLSLKRITKMGTTGTHPAAGHVVCLCRRVNDVVDRLHGEIESHELANGSGTSKSRSDGDTCETHFSNRGIDDSIITKGLP